MDSRRAKNVAAKALFIFVLALLFLSLLAQRLFHPR
jgi:hypothetical protein